MRLIIAFPPGGPVDLVGRVLAEQLGKELKQQVIVENKAGANGNIAASYVAKAPGDGSVLFLTSVGAVSISPALYKDLPYDPARDFAPVSRVVNNATVFVVNPANLAVDAADFVKRSQADSQPVAVGSSGIGSIPHLTLEMFADASRAKVMHVPYKGAAPVINDVMGNQVAGFFGDVPGLIGHIQGGKLKALGIAAPSRHPLLPDVKTLAEQGIAGVESNNWYGLVAPAATPAATVDKLNQAVRAALGSEAVRAAGEVRRPGRAQLAAGTGGADRVRPRQVDRADPAQEHPAGVSAMDACRVTPVEPGARPALAGLEARIAAARGRISPLYQVLLNSPAVTEGWEAMLTAIRQKTALAPPARADHPAGGDAERRALRVRGPCAARAPGRHAGRADRAPARRPSAGGAGGRVGGLAPGEAEALALTDAMTRGIEVSDAVFAPLRAA